MVWHTLSATFGKNDFGCIGVSTVKLEEVLQRPRSIKQLWGVELTDVSCGKNHICVVTAQGAVLTWGRNIGGSLGIGETEEEVVASPVLVEKLRDQRIMRVSCGESHTAVITDQGQVYMWGWDLEYDEDGMIEDSMDDFPELKNYNRQFRDLKCGKFCTAGIDVNGHLYTWGRNKFSMLGHGDSKLRAEPSKVEALALVKIQCVAWGRQHLAIVTENGRVYTCGEGSSGQLGLGEVTSANIPQEVQLPELDGDRVIGVSCGDTHTIVWTERGDAYSWGEYSCLRLGYDPFENVFQPRKISDLNNVKYISCGSTHNCVVLNDVDGTCLQFGGSYTDDPGLRTVSDRSRLAVCGGNHTFLYTGKFVRPTLPWFPELTPEQKADMDTFLAQTTPGTVAKRDYEKRVELLAQYLNSCKYRKASLVLETGFAEQEIAVASSDPLLGAQTSTEIRFLGFKMATAYEHEKDRQHFAKKQGLGFYEEFKGTEKKDLSAYIDL